MNIHPIHNWHIVISGFLQNEGKPTGMVQLWRELHKEHAGPDTCVALRTWRDDMNALAEMIWRLRQKDEPTHLLSFQPWVYIYGYSWGGTTAVHLARQLQRRGIPVRAMVLSDAVYRHRYFAGNWRALVPGSEIIIPKNVQEVIWFVQRQPLFRCRRPFINPRGHKLVCENPQVTKKHRSQRVRMVDHAYMDDVSVFHLAAHGVAKRAV